MTQEHPAVEFEHEADLGASAPLSVGTIAELRRADGTVWRYHCVGRPVQDLAARLGWTQGNIWLDNPTRAYILTTHPLFPRLEEAIAYVIANPDAVHEDRREPSAFYFVIEAAKLAARGLLDSGSVKLIDAVVEARAVAGGSFLRVAHFSPRHRNVGGRRLWP